MLNIDELTATIEEMPKDTNYYCMVLWNAAIFNELRKLNDAIERLISATEGVREEIDWRNCNR